MNFNRILLVLSVFVPFTSHALREVSSCSFEVVSSINGDTLESGRMLVRVGQASRLPTKLAGYDGIKLTMEAQQYHDSDLYSLAVADLPRNARANTHVNRIGANIIGRDLLIQITCEPAQSIPYYFVSADRLTVRTEDRDEGAGLVLKKMLTTPGACVAGDPNQAVEAMRLPVEMQSSVVTSDRITWVEVHYQCMDADAAQHAGDRDWSCKDMREISRQNYSLPACSSEQ